MTNTRGFRCRPEAVTAARGFVRDVLRGQTSDVLEAAELMTSELATNCVRHAHTDFEVAIHSKGQIRVEVRDTGPGRPRRLSPASREPSGRGLLIVEAMSDSWGVTSNAEGKTVWFTVAGADSRVADPLLSEACPTTP
jgi:anti-sigma regulatory factor (Ser/Thr protein kinase)